MNDEFRPRGIEGAMTELVPLKPGLTPWPYDVERLIERWREGRSPQTLRAYTSDLQNFATSMMMPSAGSAIDALLRMGQGEANELMRAYRSDMVDQGVAPATVNRRLSALVALAKEFGFVSFDLSIKNVRSEAYRDTRGPEPDIMVALLKYASTQQHRAKAARDVAIFLLLGYGRALRRSEVVKLDLQDFDARGGRVKVLRKGQRETRWLSLDPLVTRLLRGWVDKRGRDPGPLFVQVGKGGRVLSSKRLSGDGIHKILGTMGEKLGGVIRPHGLRHAAITAALDETNGNVRAAREFSGHASVEVLMKYDDNRKDVGGEVAGKVIRRIARLFGEGEK
jgi:integrase/recombinase XerC